MHIYKGGNISFKISCFKFSISFVILFTPLKPIFIKFAQGLVGGGKYFY
jgi:hypothetical protein